MCSKKIVGYISSHRLTFTDTSENVLLKSVFLPAGLREAQAMPVLFLLSGSK